MLRKMIAKVLRKVLVLLEVEENNKLHYVTNTEVKTQKVLREVTEEKKASPKLVADMSDEEFKEYYRKCAEDISAQLISKGYKALPEILGDYEDEVIKQYVMFQLITLGSYDREKDNLDVSRDKLIAMAVENNKEQFKLRMIEQGKANISKAQIDLINKLGKQIKERDNTFTWTIPNNKFDASDLIEEMNKRLGVNTKKKSVMVNGITEGQLNAIKKLSAKLNKEVEIPTSISEASKLIESLINELNNNGSNKATDKQIEYVKRLLRANNKRWTAKREEKYRAMTMQEISATIAELKASCPEINNISEGQIRYIKDLSRQLNAPIPSDLSNMSKIQATKIISKLRREYFYIQCRANGTMLSKEDIAKMSDNQIKEMLSQFKLERKTDNYTKHPEDVI